MKTQVYEVLAELERHGVTGRVEWQHKHPRVYFQAQGREVYIACALTSSDAYRGKQQVETNVRRMLGVSGARRKSGRAKAYRPRTHRVIPAPPPVIDVKSDPFAVLQGTRLMAGVLRLRADQAWKSFWDDCLRAVDEVLTP